VFVQKIIWAVVSLMFISIVLLFGYLCCEDSCNLLNTDQCPNFPVCKWDGKKCVKDGDNDFCRGYNGSFCDAVPFCLWRSNGCYVSEGYLYCDIIDYLSDACDEEKCVLFESMCVSKNAYLDECAFSDYSDNFQ
jgi:hypothetical protein